MLINEDLCSAFIQKKLAVFTDKKTDQIINIFLYMALFKWDWFCRPTIVLVAIDSELKLIQCYWTRSSWENCIWRLPLSILHKRSVPWLQDMNWT